MIDRILRLMHTFWWLYTLKDRQKKHLKMLQSNPQYGGLWKQVLIDADTGSVLEETKPFPFTEFVGFVDNEDVRKEKTEMHIRGSRNHKGIIKSIGMVKCV